MIPVDLLNVIAQTSIWMAVLLACLVVLAVWILVALKRVERLLKLTLDEWITTQHFRQR